MRKAIRLLVIPILVLGLLVAANRALAMQGEKTSAPAPVVQSGDPPVQFQADTPAKEVYRLLQERAAAQVKPGWLFTWEHALFDRDNPFPPFPNGVVMPSEFTTEAWFLVDAGGMVSKSASIQRDMQGHEIQVGLFSEGASWNTAVDEVHPQTPFPVGTFDYGMGALLDEPDLVWARAEDGSGRAVIVFSVFVNNETGPKQIGEFEEEITAGEYRFTFDEGTGLVSRYESIFTFVDGTQRVFDARDIVYEFDAALPAEVESYFQRITGGISGNQP